MKKLILALAFVPCLQTAHGAVIRVNNNAGINAPYSSLQSAINAAASGDTIYVEGSATDYGYVTLTKKLNITGTGYFLNETPPNPRTQANTNASAISTVILNPGSKGSVIQGVALSTTYINDSLITIQRCRVTGVMQFAANNPTAFDTIRNNYITSYQSAGSNNTCTGLLFYNNIFTYTYALEVNAANMNVVSGYYINNSFIAGNTTFKCVGFVFQNNIFGNADLGTYQSANSFFNNVSVSNNLPAGNGNIRGVSSNALYLSTTSTPASTDGRFQLQPASPAAGAGVMNGAAVDCGAFGGPAPYILSGMPSIPSIYSLTVPGQVSYGTTAINISLSAAAH